MAASVTGNQPTRCSRRHASAYRPLGRRFQSRAQVDWASLIRAVVDRFAGRLDLLRYILQTTSSSTISEPLDRATAAQVQLGTTLQPYILASAVPPNEHPESGGSNLTWLEGIYRARLLDLVLPVTGISRFRNEPFCLLYREQNAKFVGQWPFSLPANRRHPRPRPIRPHMTQTTSDAIAFDEDDWDLPKPKCMWRIGPYST